VNDPEAQFVAEWLAESLAATQAFAADADAAGTLLAMANAVTISLRRGGKLLIAGNGGSAADAQHIAAEFVSRMNYDRAPLAAIALTTDSSALTAIGNDYGFVHVFERQVHALGRPGDVLLAISTSGRSPNIVLALRAARERGMVTLGFTGAQGFTSTPGGAVVEKCELVLRAPSTVTPTVQQIHIIAAHIVCSLVERKMCPRTP
jgi:D-sedoheptulose 7-phosphate isomerase